MAAHERDNKLHLQMALETINSQQRALNAVQARVDLLQNIKSQVFMLSGYKKKKETDETFQFTPSFYTHPNGYLMTLGVHGNGWGESKGTHVSVYAPILKKKERTMLN